MWLSLMLLMLGGVAHVFTGVEDVYGTIVATVLLVLMLTSCLTIVNNVQQFRNMYSETTSSTPALCLWWPKVGHPYSPYTPSRRARLPRPPHAVNASTPFVFEKVVFKNFRQCQMSPVVVKLYFEIIKYQETCVG